MESRKIRSINRTHNTRKSKTILRNTPRQNSYQPLDGNPRPFRAGRTSSCHTIKITKMFETIFPTWALIIIAVWEAAWKGIALWKSGRNNHLWWFVAIFVLNTFGLLPIAYLLFFQKRAQPKLLNSLKRKKK